MIKTPEYCYQIAQRPKQDREICLQQSQKIGKFVPFELKKQDMSDCFLISEKLYGRQHEVETLLAAFERVKGSGTTEMILVAGAAGVGKTAVVKEVHKAIASSRMTRTISQRLDATRIAQPRSYFIQGKCDILQGNIPLSGLVQAVEDLIGQLLSETDAEIQQWKSKILSALGEQAQIIIDVIPKLELIIGKQPLVPEFSGIIPQDTFILLLKNFLKLFTTKDHPLVIFLDDLQWVDTLNLIFIKSLMTGNSDTIKNNNHCDFTLNHHTNQDENEGGLLFIGAYRHDEILRTHPLFITKNELKKTNIKINTINLQPLNQANSNRLIADILCCSEALAIPLNQMVFAKTKGNPFFIRRFLKDLYYEGLMQFNFDVGHWECDIAKVKALALTDDVVEAMILQIEKLPKHTQEVLKLAACIGKSFDLKTLSILYQKSVVDTASDLWAALVEGLVILEVDNDKFFLNKNTSSGTISSQEGKQQLSNTNSIPQYKFIHDRVQQAAYSQIADSKKQSINLEVGQLLLDNTSIEQRDEKIFDVVNQFNVAVALITYKTGATKLLR
ncbi:AAA family ATPase [Brasilonema sp. CT11]|nr:AAA family ATPase [Brasilonema sp. CT11]